MSEQSVDPIAAGAEALVDTTRSFQDHDVALTSAPAMRTASTVAVPGVF